MSVCMCLYNMSATQQHTWPWVVAGLQAAPGGPPRITFICNACSFVNTLCYVYTIMVLLVIILCLLIMYYTYHTINFMFAPGGLPRWVQNPRLIDFEWLL